MKKVLSFLLILLLLFAALPQTAFAKDGDEITISSMADWKKLAKKCVQDSYSDGKRVVLASDLDFGGEELISIPLFSGTFDGAGHTIRNFRLLKDTSTSGIFRRILKGGKVKNLQVSGILHPGGTAEIIGGITGENKGTIENCTFDGTIIASRIAGGIAGSNKEDGKIKHCTMKGNVSSEHRTGGIAGENEGKITGCTNLGNTGTTAIEDVRPESLDLTLTAEELIDITDVGGIVGFSSGFIENCTNEGNVGYARIGYNIGGIAGRLSGFINACQNRGSILGRKDVGGIAGQLDPDTVWDFSESNLAKLQGMLGGLQDNINTLVDDAQWMQDSLADGTENLLDKLQALGSNAVLFASDLDEFLKINGTGNIDLIGDLNAIYKESDSLSAINREDLDAAFSITAGLDSEAPVSLLNNLQDIFTALSGIEKVFADTPLLDDVQAVSDQVFSISDFLAGMFRTGSAKSSRDYVQDISDNLKDRTTGILTDSENTGGIEAETNAGGIVGAISIEFSFDREDELDLSALLSGGAKYLVFGAVQDCSSYADVHTFKNAAGGIAGRMDYGALLQCKATGSIHADADYAGGIAGLSKGTLKDCFARANLSAARYEGGIAGSGLNLLHCFAMPYLEQEAEYMGSVAGFADGDLSKNYYTESKPGAIDSSSYKGKAQHLSYKKFLKKSDNAALFRTLTLTYVFEDGSTQEVSQGFGAPVKDLPSVPDKDGKQWKWNPFKKDAIYHSMTIEGSYISPIATLSSGEEPAHFLIEGEFYEGQKFDVSPYTGETGLSLRTKDELTAWTLNVSDYESPVTVRIRMPKTTKTPTVYTRTGGGTFTEVPSEQDGTYLVFTAPASSDIALILRPNNTRLIATMSILLALILILSLHIHFLRKKMKKH